MGLLDIISKIKVGLIKGIDTLNSAYDPHESFDRPLMLPPNEDGSKPEERLVSLAEYFEADLTKNRFVSDDKILFVQEPASGRGVHSS